MSKYRQILRPPSQAQSTEQEQGPEATTDEAPPSGDRRDILSLYQALPWAVPNSMTLLFVGDSKAGKKTLAKAMLQEPWKVLTKIHTTAALPLPEDASRPRIDFLVFFVDMTNAKSLSNLKTRLLKVDKDYYAQGRSCIVATRVDLNRSHAFTTEHLEAVTNVYGVPVFYCNLTKREQVQNLSVRVYKAAELANGFIPYISPLIFAP